MRDTSVQTNWVAMRVCTVSLSIHITKNTAQLQVKQQNIPTK